MSAISANRSVEGIPSAGFRTTHWSVVLNAGGPDSPQAQAAFEQLCQTYRDPLYVYLRCSGHTPHDADDLVQGFFEKFVAGRAEKLSNVHPDNGKFRSFLIVALKRFTRDEWQKKGAAKRGGQMETVSLDEESADGQPLVQPADKTNPEKEFDRRWAKTVLANAFKALETEMAKAGKVPLFGALAEFLQVKGPGKTHREVAAQLGEQENTIRLAVQKLRRRYAEMLRAEVANTLANPTPEAVNEELQSLFKALE